MREMGITRVSPSGQIRKEMEVGGSVEKPEILLQIMKGENDDRKCVTRM
jgi:hypothetical protein